jgi:hypothetical protein
MRPSDKAWIALGIGVGVYEVAAGDGELLSEAADRYMLSHPWLTRAAVAAIALHLCNAFPEQFDIIHRLLKAKHLLR